MPSTAHPRQWSTRLSLLLAVLVGALALSGWATPSARAAVPGDAWVRAAHLVPGLEAMQVVVRPLGGGSPSVLAERAAYGDVAPYQRLTPGDYTVELRPAGAAASSAPVLSSTVTVEAGRAYTLAGLGSLQSPRLATLQDDLTPPAAGTVRVRLLPAASSADQVTVAAVDGPVVARDAVFGQPTAYAAVPAGRWTLQATSGGDQPTSTTVDLAAGGIYTLAVVDRDGGGLGIQVVTDAAGSATMPVGGAATGGGGTAAGSPTGVPGGLLAGAALLAALTALTGSRAVWSHRRTAARSS